MITHEKLKEMLDYNKETGVFTWKARGIECFDARFANKPAGRKINNGYIQIKLNYVAYYAHRLAWFYVHKVWPTNEIDHIDRNQVNNKISNLRLATRAENSQNRASANSTNKTGLLGARYRKDRNYFESWIKANNKCVYLGAFSTKEDAHEAYLKAKTTLHPTWNKICA